jgi:hypothetical protein
MFAKLFGGAKHLTETEIPQTVKLTTTQYWSLAAGANLVVSNDDHFSQLANNFSQAEAKHLLDSWWDVHNSSEALQTLDWLEQSGHNSRFRPLYENLSKLRKADFSQLASQVNAEERQTYQFVWDNLANFKDGHLLAWDYGRLINVCRFCYTAGYLSEGLTWERISVAARRLQKSYTSWEELGEQYGLGWQYWKKGQALQPRQLKAQQWLLTDPNSPWIQLSWQTTLVPNRSNR